MDPDVEGANAGLNYAFTLYFAGELVLKLLGLGLRAYFADGMNRFDAAVVVASVVDMALSLSPISSGASAEARKRRSRAAVRKRRSRATAAA